MSNLSTLPKGDSAWLLRKAIQRIIQQVSVLETNIGSSTTGNSANTQVIFNDNGVLRGDSGLTYNAATDLLSVGAATITGDLTVDTSTLKVDSTNNRVGVGTASPSVPLEIRASDNSVLTTGGSANFTQFKAQIDSGAGTSIGSYQNIFGYVGTSSNHYLEIRANNIAQQKIEPLGVFNWFDGAGGTRMTLNANGLGLGVTPSAWGTGYKAIQLASSQSTALMGSGNQTELTTNAFFDSAWKYQGAGTVAASRYSQQSGVHYWFNAAAGAANSAITWTQAMTLDASGNLGVGTTSPASYGNLAVFGSGNGIVAVGQGVSYTTLQSNGNDFYLNMKGSGSTIFRNGSGDTERMRIKPNGQLRFVPLAADPAGAEAGDVYYNSISNKLKCYNGTTWNDLF